MRYAKYGDCPPQFPCGGEPSIDASEEVADMIQPYIEAGANHVVLGDSSGVVDTAAFFGGVADRHWRNSPRTFNGQPIPNAVPTA